MNKMAEKNDQKMRERESGQKNSRQNSGTACTGKKEKKYARVSGNQ